MDGSVIQFPGRQPEPPQEDEARMVWACVCGCLSFNLLAGGGAECCACGLSPDDAEGGWLEGKDPAAPPPRDVTIFDEVQGAGTADFARSRIARAARDPSAMLIVVSDETGGTKLWADAEGPEQLSWCRARLTDALQMLQGGAGDGAD